MKERKQYKYIKPDGSVGYYWDYPDTCSEEQDICSEYNINNN